jgi:hypothetical protein
MLIGSFAKEIFESLILKKKNYFDFKKYKIYKSVNSRGTRPKMNGQIKKTEIIKLIRRVNVSKRRVREGLLPLSHKDDGWRVILPKSLEFYDFLPAGRRLMEMAIFDLDMKGEYYWIPYSSPPRGVTTPAM